MYKTQMLQNDKATRLIQLGVSLPYVVDTTKKVRVFDILSFLFYPKAVSLPPRGVIGLLSQKKRNPLAVSSVPETDFIIGF